MLGHIVKYIQQDKIIVDECVNFIQTLSPKKSDAKTRLWQWDLKVK